MEWTKVGSHEIAIAAQETAHTKIACMLDDAKSVSQKGYGQSPATQDKRFRWALSFSKMTKMILDDQIACCRISE